MRPSSEMFAQNFNSRVVYSSSTRSAVVAAASAAAANDGGARGGAVRRSASAKEAIDTSQGKGEGRRELSYIVETAPKFNPFSSR